MLLRRVIAHLRAQEWAAIANGYVDNSGRNANVLQTFARREQQLVALKAVLAAKLGIQAQREMPTP